MSVKPVGYMKSPFTFKNGTPRQPNVCQSARGEITVDKNMFNNPEHSLEDLEKFSHVWILFLFHKNNNEHHKAKVSPPRLNGKKTGVFASRSPYRPNNIGLTLAKIESVHGATLAVSGIDILDGTPVIDLKPYIPEYDSPSPAMQAQDDNQIDICDDMTSALSQSESDTLQHNNQCIQPCTSGSALYSETDSQNAVPGNSVAENLVDSDAFTAAEQGDHLLGLIQSKEHKLEETGGSAVGSDCGNHLEKNIDSDTVNAANVSTGSTVSRSSTVTISGPHITESGETTALLSERVKQEKTFSEYEKSAKTADWIQKAPVNTLKVRFTPSADDQIQLFSSEAENVNFRLQHLMSSKEAREAITQILHEDPRSTYRRRNCLDRLYYFTYDAMHITSWFDEDSNSVEIVRIKPVTLVEKLKDREEIRNKTS